MQRVAERRPHTREAVGRLKHLLDNSLGTPGPFCMHRCEDETQEAQGKRMMHARRRTYNADKDSGHTCNAMQVNV